MNDEELDNRLRIALRAEAYRPRFTIEPGQLATRLSSDSRDQRQRPLVRAGAAFAAVVLSMTLVAVVVVTPRATGTLASAPPSRTLAVLPVGTYMTTKALAGKPCFAFELAAVEYDRPTQVAGWWWDQGESGDCRTRTSDVVASMLTISRQADARYDLLLRLPSMAGGFDDVRVTISVTDGRLSGSVGASDQPVMFSSVATVEPSFAPVH